MEESLILLSARAACTCSRRLDVSRLGLDASEIYQELKASALAGGTGLKTEPRAGAHAGEQAGAHAGEQDAAAASGSTSADFAGHHDADPSSLCASFDGLSPFSQQSAAGVDPSLNDATRTTTVTECGVGMRVLPHKGRQGQDDDDMSLPAPEKVRKKKARNRDGGARPTPAASTASVSSSPSSPHHQHAAAASSTTGRTPPRGWGAAGASSSMASLSPASETLEEIQQREALEQRRKDAANRADLRARHAGGRGAASWPAPASSPAMAADAHSAKGAQRSAAALASSPPSAAQWKSPSQADAGSPSGASGEDPRDGRLQQWPGAQRSCGKKAVADDDDLFWGAVPGKNEHTKKSRASHGGGAAKTAASVVAGTPPSAGARGGWPGGSPGSSSSFSLLDFAPQAKPSRKGKNARKKDEDALGKELASPDGNALQVPQLKPSPPLPSIASIQAEEEKRLDKRRLHKAKITNKVGR